MPGNPQPHERHDRYLVAALAADDLEPAIRPEAEALIRSCTDCAELMADLRSIAAATHALPPVPRPRDFTISAADAARLLPGGWRALLDAIGGARATFARRLAVGLTTLGLAGILAATIPGALTGGLGSAASTPAGAPEVAAAPTSSRDLGLSNPDGAGQASALASAAASEIPPPAPSAAATAAATGGFSGPEGSAAPSYSAIVQAAPSATLKASSGGVPGGKDRGTTGDPGDGSSGTTADDTTRFAAIDTNRAVGPAPLLIVSLVLLALGLGLFAVRWAAGWSAHR
jgi:hypothetical protein